MDKYSDLKRSSRPSAAVANALIVLSLGVSLAGLSLSVYQHVRISRLEENQRDIQQFMNGIKLQVMSYQCHPLQSLLEMEYRNEAKYIT